MRIRRRSSLQSSINITPFVDVMLVLLIVFMVCAPMMQSGVDLSLPKTSARQKKVRANTVTISINKSGILFINKTRIQEKDFVQQLAKIHKKNPSVQCMLCADASLNYERVLSILSLINQVGIENVSLVSESRQKKGQ